MENVLGLVALPFVWLFVGFPYIFVVLAAGGVLGALLNQRYARARERDPQTSCRPPSGKFAAGVVILALAAPLVVFGVHELRIHRASTAIAGALESHRQQHGVYPDKLAKLVPNYLGRIPNGFEGYRLTPTGYRFELNDRSLFLYRDDRLFTSEELTPKPR